MTIFAVLMPVTQPALIARITAEYGTNALQVTDTQWLVSGTGTAQDVSKKLGVYDTAQPSAASTGNAIIFATSGYFGRAPSNIWEWLRVQLETPVTRQAIGE